MSKSTVHVLIPFTTSVACGQPGYVAHAMYREKVTCKRCRKTDHFKRLKNWPNRK